MRGRKETYLEPETVTETVVWGPVNKGLTLRFLEVNPKKSQKNCILEENPNINREQIKRETVIYLELGREPIKAPKGREEMNGNAS